MTRIIINADDYGFCDEIDDGVVAAAQNKLINSVAAFSNGPKWEDRLKRISPLQASGLNIGCHLTITSGRAVTEAARKSRLLTTLNGRFYKYNELKRPKSKWLRDQQDQLIKNELYAQIDRMNQHELDITIAHLSSHHDALVLFPEYFEILLEISDDLQIPLRSADMQPALKEFFYYRQIGLRLTDDMSRKSKRDYKKFRKNRGKWYAENKSRFDLPKTPAVVDGSNYVTRSLLLNVKKLIQQEFVAHKKFNKLKKAIENQPEKQVHEYCVHICHPKANISKDQVKFVHPMLYGRPNPDYYNGVNLSYFDGRKIEYKSLEFLKQELAQDTSVKLISWDKI